ncbi:MAG: acyl-CoA dehydrogenase family protein [Actinomycetota bacterium]
MTLTESPEEADLIRDTATAFFDRAGGVRRARQLRDSDERYSPDVWSAMAELGWTGITAPAAYGGAGLSIAEALPVLEAMGRVLAPEPLLSTILATELIRVAGTGGQQEEWIPALSQGRTVMAVAGVHSRRSCRLRTNLQIQWDGESLVVHGEAGFVPDGGLATAIIALSADAPEGVIVPVASGGVRVISQPMIDSRDWAMIEFDHVRLPATARLEAAPEMFDAAIDRATLAGCGEMLGAMWEVYDRTLAYTKERVQFGQPIGSFQAVQHRLARLYTELLVADASVRGASEAVATDQREASALASAAKARCNAVARLVSKEGIQFHGGIGVTDECDIGLFIKRLRITQFLFGDDSWHIDRWATHRGY